jgi:hypothetical protein
MSTPEDHDPFAPIEPLDLPASFDASGNVPTAASHVPHHLLGAVAPIDPRDPFAGGEAVAGANAFGVQAFDHASALNDNPFTATAAVDDQSAEEGTPLGNPLATLTSASPSGDPFGD